MEPLGRLLAAECQRGLGASQRFLTVEVPTILDMAAKALQKAPIPTQPSGWLQLSPAQWLQLAPILSW